MQTQDIPIGLCQCGCGARTNPAPSNSTKNGWVKGRPMRYVKGHAHKGRELRHGWIEEDHGFSFQCWIWQGAVNNKGYGVSTKGRYVHRVVWEQTNGPIPEGLEIDHLCKVPLCCNPDHLEPVTRRENIMRSNWPSAVHARKTHCIHGHPFDEENTYRPKRGGRQCMACTRERSRRYAEARRAA